MDSNGRLMNSQDAMKVMNDNDVINKMKGSGYDIAHFRQVETPSSQAGMNLTCRTFLEALNIFCFSKLLIKIMSFKQIRLN